MTVLFRKRIGLREYVFGLEENPIAGVVIDVPAGIVSLHEEATIEDLDAAIHDCERLELPPPKSNVPMVGSVE